jgi:PAS domain S-box-containing protein
VVKTVDSLETFKTFMPSDELMHLARTIQEWGLMPRGQLREDEYLLRHANGTMRSFLGRETVFANHPGGRARLILGTLYDITERKLTEARLQQSEKRYRLIVENQTEFIVKWLPDGTRTFVNESYCRTFGCREENCIGTSFFPLVAPEYRQAIAEQTAALTPEIPEYTEEHVSLVAGGRRWQQWINRGIFDADGQLVEVLSTGRDISERVKLEEQLRQSQKMQAIGQPAGGVAPKTSPDD